MLYRAAGFQGKKSPKSLFSEFGLEDTGFPAWDFPTALNVDNGARFDIDHFSKFHLCKLQFVSGFFTATPKERE